MVNATVDAKALPPVAVAYHWIELPVAVKSATVAVSIVQKLCSAAPVGAAGSLIVTTTANRVALSHDPTV